MANILIIVDDFMFRKLLCKLVENAGHAFVEAEDGVAGLAAIGETSPDLVVTDMEMPKMTGFELLRHLRDDPANAHLPIVVVSAHETTADRDEAHQLGCNAYVLKTLPPDDLIKRILAVLPT